MMSTSETTATATIAPSYASSRRLNPKKPPISDPTTAQMYVYNHMVELINQEPVSVVDKLYDVIPDAHGGKVIGTDAARDLSPYYANSREGAILYAPVTSSPASAYAQDRFRREISSPSHQRRTLLMTAGGPAAGKTASIGGEDVIMSYDLVMDQNLGKYDRAVEQIELAVENGWDVVIYYVYKPFHLAVQKVIERAGKRGRWSPLKQLVGAHKSAQDSVAQLYEQYAGHSNVEVRLVGNFRTKENPVAVEELALKDIQPGGRCHFKDPEQMKEVVREAIEKARMDGKTEARLLAALAEGTNPDTSTGLPPLPPSQAVISFKPEPPVFVMSRYHVDTHSTDRHLGPLGVLKLSSGDCKILMKDDVDDSKVKALMAKVNASPQCKVTWGTTVSRRKERIKDILAKHPELNGKLYVATPYEEAHATAVSCKMHPDVKGVQFMVAFGGSCLHVLSVNQLLDNTLQPGPNEVTKRLPNSIMNAKNAGGEDLCGTDADWIPDSEPPLPEKGTFYATFPLDGDLNEEQYVSIATLFDALNSLEVQGGSFLVCGAPTHINPHGKWWPDKSARAVKTTFKELAQLAGIRQSINADTGITTGGLLSDKHPPTAEMVLTAMAAPRLTIAAMTIAKGELPGLGKAMKYFGVGDAPGRKM